jgi:hypothetical protein
MKLSRMTTRRWMATVAVVGLFLALVVGGWRLVKRRAYCLRQAESHTQSERLYRSIAKAFVTNYENLSTSVTVRGPSPHLVLVGEQIYSADVLADYYADLTKKYHRVASRPWLPIEPEPPPPDYH